MHRVSTDNVDEDNGIEVVDLQQADLSVPENVRAEGFV